MQTTLNLQLQLASVKIAQGAAALVDKQLQRLAQDLTFAIECDKVVQLSEDGRNRTIMTIAEQNEYMEEWNRERSEGFSKAEGKGA